MQQLNPKQQIILAYVTLTLCASELQAGIALFTNKAVWEAAVDDFTTIGFANLPVGTWVTEQYADLGAHFTDGADQVIGTSLGTYPQDGVGLSGFSGITVEFDAPQYWLAVDFPGLLEMDLFWKGQVIYSKLGFGGGGSGFFGGVITDQPFDKVILSDADGFVFIDDLHFGPPIPAPSALGVLASGLLMHRTRRRRL